MTFNGVQDFILKPLPMQKLTILRISVLFGLIKDLIQLGNISMLEDLVKTCLEDIIPSIITKIQDNEEEKKIKIQKGKFCQKRSFEKNWI